MSGAGVEARGTTFAVVDEGAGDVVLNAHGLTWSTASARRVGFPTFPAVAAAGHRLVSYDARGHGGTPGTTDPRQYEWPALAADMVALAERLSPERPVAAIGCSMGSATALHAALLAPEKFECLVLTALPVSWEERAARRADYLALAREVASGERTVAGFYDGPSAPIFAALPDYPPAPEVPVELLPAVLEGAASSDLPAPDALREITVPTLLLPWASDPAHPVEVSRRVAELLPRARVEVAESVAEIRGWSERACDFLAAVRSDTAEA